MLPDRFPSRPAVRPAWFAGLSSLAALGLLSLSLMGCGGSTAASTPTPTPTPAPSPTPTPATIPMMAPTSVATGDVTLTHDPSIIYQAGASGGAGFYYSLSTDPGPQNGQTGYLPIISSSDKKSWARSTGTSDQVGAVFTAVPAFVQAYFAAPASPMMGKTFTTFWAPDVSYFHGLYHVYYAASSFGQNYSLIGLATNPTMNPNDPAYKWTDQGMVLNSTTMSNFNAIDPSILVDTDATGATTHVWLTYGSFWSGIFQQEINPATGLLLNANTAAVNLATRPGVSGDPIEGPNLVKHNGYYYLFASFDFCCQTPSSSDNYKIAVGRSSSPQGPFLDQTGLDMMKGGGTIILESGANWIAPGGSTVLVGAPGGDVIAYHALSVASNYLDYLFVDTITWPNDWPVIQQ